MTGKQYNSMPLASNWSFKQGDRSSKNKYCSANDLPTEIYRDLLKNDQIAHPFRDLNDAAVRWVGDQTWTYKTTFTTPPEHGESGVMSVLKFEGLDTFATVYLNGACVLRSKNMFVAHHINVTHDLKGNENLLEIVFESARTKGFELVKEHLEHRFIVHQTEISRGPVRKAQYHWGWDWGPILLSCGPWKPISIETFACTITDLWVEYELGADMRSAEVKASAMVRGPIRYVTFTIMDNRTGKVRWKIAAETGPKSASSDPELVGCTLDIKDIELWWPRGYGGQQLYTICAQAHTEDPSSVPAHTLSKTVGFRKTELVQEEDSHGTSFYFRINEVDMFIGGSCWISADSFLTSLTPSDYKKWVELAAAGNQSMLRIWGGGIYENDSFYNAADELGIMVWQDFAFACANYPTYPTYLESVKEEAKQNVRRLRHHPSLVLWCGNNEDYQIPERYNIPYDRDEKNPQKWLETEFPARYIYEYLLPEVVMHESPGTLYHPSSPYGNSKSTTLVVDPTIGDVHQWNVWHGTQEPYQKLPDMGGRFVSEFGMEAYPHLQTLSKWITQSKDRQPGTMTMDARNKAIGHERRLVTYVAENFRIQYNVESFTHLTQVMQADAMAWAYKSWRRQWGSPRDRKCGGVLVWQLNDCWPTVSWAVVDYHMVPKPAYYAIKRAMEPVVVCIQRKYRPWTMRPADPTWQRDTGHVDMGALWRNAEFSVWIGNSTLEVLKETYVQMKAYSIRTGAETVSLVLGPFTIAANGTTSIFEGAIDALLEAQQLSDTSNIDPYVVETKFLVGDEVISSDTAWPDPIKYLSFEDRGIEVRYADEGKNAIVSAKRPVKGFVFDLREGIGLSDNGFDIMPGQVKELSVTGCAAEELKWMYIGI